MRGGLVRFAPLFAALLAAAGAAGAEDNPAPRSRHWTLDGWTVGAEAARTGESTSRLFLLLAPAGAEPDKHLDEVLRGPGSAFSGGVSFSVGGGELMEAIDSRFDAGGRFRPEGSVALLSLGSSEPEPVALRDDLPADGMALAVRRAVGGQADELFVLGPGRADSLGPASAPLEPLRTSIADAGIDPAGTCPRRGERWIPRFSGDTAWIARGGHLYSLRPRDGERLWTRADEVALPRHAYLGGGGIRLWSHRPRALRDEEKSSTIFAGPARGVGRTRLRWQVIEAPDDGSPPRSEEFWFQLGGPRFVVASVPMLVDGAPALAAWSFRADKISLFAKPRIELFLAAEDRSRAGRPAAFRLDGLSGKQRSARPLAMDIDSDGRDDLVLGYADGRRWRIEIYRQRAAGSFESRPRKSSLALEKDETVEAWRLVGSDPSRGLPEEILLATSRRLMACPRTGVAGEASRLFRIEACRSAPRDHPAGEGTWLDGDRRWVDLTGDGVPELIWFSLSDGGKSWVSVTDFRPSAPDSMPPRRPGSELAP